MDAFGFDTCREQHISLSYEFLRTRAVYYSGGIHSGSHAERNSHREVALDESVDDIYGWTLCGQDDMQTGGTSLLGKADDGIGNASACRSCFRCSAYRHGKICVFIHHYHYVRKVSVSMVRAQLALLVSGVVQLDVVDSGLAEKFVPVIHLYTEGAQNLLRVLRILDDGTVGLILFRACIRQYCEVVLKKLGIRRELHHLRINEDKLQL
ncbi:unknown [Bacteroides sp. CAG:1060]|nr:unknown [Bacteroides sp. CAG:1060]